MTNGVEKVEFIGLGRMGIGIARNILKAGFSLAVFNRTPSKAEGLTKAGARLATSARDAAAGADAVLTCLMDDQSVLDAVDGPEGILAGLRRGGVHVGITTISALCAERLAGLHTAKGTHYVAAPVVGRPDVAAAGQLRTFVAGDPDAIARCQRGRIHHCAGTVALCEHCARSAVDRHSPRPRAQGLERDVRSGAAGRRAALGRLKTRQTPQDWQTPSEKEKSPCRSARSCRLPSSRTTENVSRTTFGLSAAQTGFFWRRHIHWADQFN